MELGSFVVVVMLLVIWLWNSTYRIGEGERGVVLRLGRMMEDVKEPGLHLIPWPVETLYRISTLEQTLEIPGREYLIDGSRTLQLALKLTFRVVDAKRALSQVQNYLYALSSLGEKTMEAVARKQAGAKYLAGEGTLGDMVKRQMEDAAREWGIEVANVDVLRG
jgi:regulator of protease activity HflC (stomatin/prohibitin superfamily)